MKEITLTAIFEGTVYSIEEPNTHLHKILHTDCKGVRIRSSDEFKKHPDDTHFKMGFNGCGIENGALGVLFGAGLEEQYKQVETVVKDMIKAGNKVKLNLIGLSRGGVASILLAKRLGMIDSYHLETNMLLLDPVPGNLEFTPSLDIFNISLANQAMNLSKSRNLKYVEALYPYLEVGDDTGELLDQFLGKFHVPIRPSYPKHCEVKEEVILGAHLRAFQDMEKNNDEGHLRYGLDLIPVIKKLSKKIMYLFLNKVGSLESSQPHDEMTCFDEAFKKNEGKWSGILQGIIETLTPSTRPLHSRDNSKIHVTNRAPFLNKIHRDLKEGDTSTHENLCFKVMPERIRTPLEKSPLSKNELLDLIKVIEDNMTSTSKNGKKGALIQNIRTTLERHVDFNDEQLSFVLRDILAVALQRDRNMFSFYSTTDSGIAIISALNKRDFQSVRQCIRLDGKDVKYTDLSGYVVGQKDLSHFYTTNKKENLTQLEEHQCGRDSYSFLLR